MAVDKRTITEKEPMRCEIIWKGDRKFVRLVSLIDCTISTFEYNGTKVKFEPIQLQKGQELTLELNPALPEPLRKAFDGLEE
jgi:hypothetical protein